MESVIGNKPKANVQANRYVQDDEFDDDFGSTDRNPAESKGRQLDDSWDGEF